LRRAESDLGAAAGTRRALADDAGLAYDKVQQAYVGYVYGDSTCGQRALYPVGMTGIPVVNVNNNCSTGSTALFLARQAVASGAADCVIALVGHPDTPMAILYFGGAGMAHMDKYGTRVETFAKIRAKASRHAVNNPVALFRKEVTVEGVMASPVLIGPMTRLMACPPTYGGACVVTMYQASWTGERYD